MISEHAFFVTRLSPQLLWGVVNGTGQNFCGRLMLKKDNYRHGCDQVVTKLTKERVSYECCQLQFSYLKELNIAPSTESYSVPLILRFPLIFFATP